MVFGRWSRVGDKEGKGIGGFLAIKWLVVISAIAKNR